MLEGSAILNTHMYTKNLAIFATNSFKLLKDKLQHIQPMLESIYLNANIVSHKFVKHIWLYNIQFMCRELEFLLKADIMVNTLRAISARISQFVFQIQNPNCQFLPIPNVLRGRWGTLKGVPKILALPKLIQTSASGNFVVISHFF